MTGCRTEDSHIAWADNLNPVYDVPECSVGRGDDDRVPRLYSSQGSEQCVAMCCDTDIPRGPRQSSSVHVPGGYSKSFRSCAFKNSDGKMQAGNLNASDRFSKARRNDHESVWRHWSVAVQLPVARLLVDEPVGRPLRAKHIELDIRIPGKSERAPYAEGAPEIED